MIVWFSRYLNFELLDTTANGAITHFISIEKKIKNQMITYGHRITKKVHSLKKEDIDATDNLGAMLV